MKESTATKQYDIKDHDFQPMSIYFFFNARQLHQFGPSWIRYHSRISAKAYDIYVELYEMQHSNLRWWTILLGPMYKPHLHTFCDYLLGIVMHCTTAPWKWLSW